MSDILFLELHYSSLSTEYAVEQVRQFNEIVNIFGNWESSFPINL